MIDSYRYFKTNMLWNEAYIYIYIYKILFYNEEGTKKNVKDTHTNLKLTQKTKSCQKHLNEQNITFPTKMIDTN